MKNDALFFALAAVALLLYSTNAGDDAGRAPSGPLGDLKMGAVKIYGTAYDDLIAEAANANNIPPDVLWRLLYTESRFRDDIITGETRSPVGALGIAQFMPATAVEELGSVEAALDPWQAIPGAARYLAKLVRWTGSLDAAVAAYNWGVGNVKRKGLANAPQETINYVAAITGTDITA